jgi:hypothetical protein
MTDVKDGCDDFEGKATCDDIIAILTQVIDRYVDVGV